MPAPQRLELDLLPVGGRRAPHEPEAAGFRAVVQDLDAAVGGQPGEVGELGRVGVQHRGGTRSQQLAEQPPLGGVVGLRAAVVIEMVAADVGERGGGEDEFELSEDECDTVFYTGGTIDLGEAAAETLALGLDPYPRSPNAAAALREAGVISEDEAKAQAEASGPFGGLAALRDKLGKG